MNKIIKFPKAHVDDQDVYENIPADVAIAHNGEVATSGDGSVDAYRCSDFIGVTVESLRSPSGTDSWHHRNGYQHSPKAIEGFIHHPEHGQIARLTHIF